MTKTNFLVRTIFLSLVTLALSGCLSDEPVDNSSVDGLSIEITNPGNTSSISTPDIVVNIWGTTDSDFGVESVVWKNDRGGKGDANGKEDWVTGNIVLQLGVNKISITATDAKGSSVTELLTVEREDTAAKTLPAGQIQPTIMYSYNSDLSNAAPVAGASILQQSVYLFARPGDDWQQKGMSEVSLICCGNQPGPEQGGGSLPEISIGSAPWATMFNLSTVEQGGGRRASMRATFADGSRSIEISADFSVSGMQPADNQSPTIAGLPIEIGSVGNQYNFRPTASDADGDTVWFNIVNKPAWASFDELTGRLYGMPDAGHIGIYSDIVVSVSDGKESASLPAFSINVEAFATGNATLTWSSPTERTDDSPLGSSLSGFHIYYGQSAGDYANKKTLTNAGLTSYMVENLSSGTWYFTMTAFDSNGLESNPSNERQKSF